MRRLLLMMIGSVTLMVSGCGEGTVTSAPSVGHSKQAVSDCEAQCIDSAWIPCIESNCPDGYLDCPSWAYGFCTDAYEQCVDACGNPPCVPNCSSVPCFADDGCGGVCNNCR
jgi:hypothetical protein